MRRKASLTHEKLVEEARFILRNLQRSDVFGDAVHLAEADRVLSPSASLPFSDYVGFFTKYGYLRLEGDGHTIAVTSGGAQVAGGEDPEFRARVARHFARELSAAAGRPRAAEPSGLSSSVPLEPGLTAVVRTRRPLGSQRPALDQVLDRRYRRGPLIGRSALGAVYRGTHESLGRPIAIKETNTVFQFASYLRREEVVDRLRVAVEATAGLAHPHVAQLIDQNLEREHPYVVSELAPGGNLRQRLAVAENGQLDLRVSVRALVQMCHALAHAHERGVLHLGLKPENVLFDGLGNVKLSDFGLTRVLEQPADAGPAPMMVGGSAVGYFAPERLQPGEVPDLGPTADIYALGIIFYEMLTGRLPGRRSPLPSAARAGVPEAFDDVFDKMTRDATDERYESMDDVLEGIHEAFGTELVFEPGAIVVWAEDPGPIPPPPEVQEDEDEPIEDVEMDEVEALDMDALTPIPVEAVESSLRPDDFVAAGDLMSSSRGPRRAPPPPPED